MPAGGLSGEDELNDLVGSIYDAALEVQLWPDILNRIGDAVGGPVIVFGFYDPINGIANVHSPRMDPNIARTFEDWMPEVPALPCTGNYAPGRVFTGADVISRDAFASTAFYHEWWRPSGLTTDPLVTNLLADGSATGHLASHAPSNRPFASGQKRLFASLAQHVIRALALQRRLHHLTFANKSVMAGLDALQQGFLLVDAQARVLLTNSAANKLLEAHDGLRLDAGALSASDADGARILRAMIASCADAKTNRTGGEVSLRREAGRSSLNLVVAPVRPEKIMIDAPWIFRQRPAAIVLVSDPGTEVKARAESLRLRFGFTPAETAMALEIVKGDGRQAAADRLGVTLATARTHLSSIFDKTGVRHQAELVRLLLK